MTVTFFGHRDAPKRIIIKLFMKIVYLIRNTDNCKFIVGNNGNFDKMALTCLKILKVIYPKTEFRVITAYEKSVCKKYHYFPHEIAAAGEMRRIPERNYWLINHSSCVISYVRRDGCANHFTCHAATKGRHIIYL